MRGQGGPGTQGAGLRQIGAIHGVAGDMAMSSEHEGMSHAEGHGDTRRGVAPGRHHPMAAGPRATGAQVAAVAVLSLLLLGTGVVLALLGQDPEVRARSIVVSLIIWFALTVLALAYVGWDAFTVTPQPVIMKWGWLLMTLYTGPLGVVLYVLSCQEPAPSEHERFVEPLWKQGLGSTIHCVAGDATGVIASAVVTATLGQPMWLDVLVEYVAGFAFGLLVLQALFMRRMLGGSYMEAVRRSFPPEWLSTNGVMAGMIPVMVLLMGRDMAAMEPWSPRFWGVMSLTVMAGTAVAYPLNVWLVRIGSKHGMGTERPAGGPPGGISTQHMH